MGKAEVAKKEPPVFVGDPLALLEGEVLKATTAMLDEEARLAAVGRMAEAYWREYVALATPEAVAATVEKIAAIQRAGSTMIPSPTLSAPADEVGQ